jgi:hypothetical protein
MFGTNFVFYLWLSFTSACAYIENATVPSENNMSPYSISLLWRTSVMSSIFWDITQYSPLKVNEHFGGTCLIRIYTIFRDVFVSCFTPRFFAWFTLRHWRWRRHVLLKHRFTFNGLHCFISQKIKIFITTTVRTTTTTSVKRPCSFLSPSISHHDHYSSLYVITTGIHGFVMRKQGLSLSARVAHFAYLDTTEPFCRLRIGTNMEKPRKCQLCHNLVTIPNRARHQDYNSQSKWSWVLSIAYITDPNSRNNILHPEDGGTVFLINTENRSLYLGVPVVLIHVILLPFGLL